MSTDKLSTGLVQTTIIFAGFASTVPLANWLVGNAGTICVPGGPCLVPVWPGLMAPSGVLAIGVALVLRDRLHEQAGAMIAALAVVAGAALSALLAPPSPFVRSKCNTASPLGLRIVRHSTGTHTGALMAAAPWG